MNNKYSVTLYGTAKAGFTYLLALDGGGLVPTYGHGSDYGVSGCGRGPTVGTIDEAVAKALHFVTEGAEVCVHAPGSGRVIRRGRKTVVLA